MLVGRKETSGGTPEMCLTNMVKMGVAPSCKRASELCGLEHVSKKHWLNTSQKQKTQNNCSSLPSWETRLGVNVSVCKCT